MILKAYYDDGRFECFDSDHLTDPSRLPGNLLTNWSLDLGGVENGCLLLNLYWYPDESEEAGPAGLPVALRRDGLSFVVADSDDIPHLLKLTIDGDAVLLRVGGELVDCHKFDHATNLAGSFLGHAAKAIGMIGSRMTARGKSHVDEAVMREMGMRRESFEWTLEELSRMQQLEEPEREQEDRFER